MSGGGKVIRVLHVLGGMNRGGVETWLMNIVRSGRNPDIQHDFLVHTHAECAYDRELLERGARIFRCPAPRRSLRYATEVRRVLREEGPFSVIHSHVHHFSGVVLALARSARVPVRIAHSHNDTGTIDAAAGRLRRSYLAGMRLLLSMNSTHRLACSQAAAHALFGRGDNEGTPSEFLPLAIELAPYSQEVDVQAVRAELGIPSEALVITHVGRFAEQKNHRLILEIASVLTKVEPRIHFLLLGEGPLRKEIEQESRARGLTPHMTFAGARPDVPRLLLGAADAFLFPSLYEGLGLALLEAQAAGLPCIVSDVVPREADVVQDLITRCSLQASPTEWAHSILDALRTRSHGTQRLALQALAQSVYGIDGAANALAAYYRQAVRACT